MKRAKPAIRLRAGTWLAPLLLAGCNSEAQPQPSARPDIWLMTSLPIIWGEGAGVNDILENTTQPAPLYRHWQARYAMTPVDSLERLATSDPDIILMVQPRAMAPADLADLDRWVRDGGRALILTDPMLHWPSDLPIGDPRRPLAVGLLSPLLTHWGLDLAGANRGGAGQAHSGEASAGHFALNDGGSEVANCVVEESGFSAECWPEKGHVLLIADVDFLNEDAEKGTPEPWRRVDDWLTCLSGAVENTINKTVCYD